MQLNTITIIEENEEWVVVVLEDGVETRKTFTTERFARNWHDSQRLRLGLPALEDTQ